ncbi:hypothetical protein BGZ47_003941 [Haplosporangium gracile]|nr:hypothetical protein BGZ47_003941 [Haplosporangium gracile]
MASKNGQILYLGGSSGTQGNAGGSLSTRFQKLAQSRNNGITVVNPSTGIESRPGRSLGLGFATGSHPQGPGGHRISTATTGGPLSTRRGAGTNNKGGRSGGGGSGLVPGGLHTAGGLARAMQERGTGVSDEFLLAPAASIAATGGRGPVLGSRRDRRQNAAGAGAGGAVIGGTRATRHKALVLGGRPGRRQQAAAAAVLPTIQQQRQRSGAAQAQAGAQAGGRSNAIKAAKAAAKAVGGSARAGTGAAGATGKGKKGMKSDKAKPAVANAGELDSQLDAYMMKDTKTAASMLDNDLDSYMADKPAENSW